MSDDLIDRPASPTAPRLNEPAPEFEAQTTQGPRRLSDYRGKWLVLFSHPADFTPVCTTEFIGFAEAYEAFRAVGCELLGLSIDSVHSHISWIRAIKERFGVDIPFPVIADLSMTVARLYGMIQPGASETSAVRALFVIDPDSVLRAMLYYPLTNGRSVAEVLRLVRSLQTTDRFDVVTPQGWQPGEPVLLPPPLTVDRARMRVVENPDCTDWYFCKKPLPEAAETTSARAPSMRARAAQHSREPAEV